MCSINNNKVLDQSQPYLFWTHNLFKKATNPGVKKFNDSLGGVSMIPWNDIVYLKKSVKKAEEVKRADETVAMSEQSNKVKIT